MPELRAFDAMLGECAAPVLKAAGFRKSGRTFRFVAGHGDHAFVHFQTFVTDHEPWTDFFVNLSVVPVPQLDWLRRDHRGPARKPVPGEGLWQGRVDAPEEVATPGWAPSTDLWRFSPVDPRCGAVLAEVLHEQAVPLLLRLTDRAEFLAMIRDPAKPLGPGLGHPIVLMADEGPSPELDAEIAYYEALDPVEWPVGPEIVAWARARASLVQ